MSSSSSSCYTCCPYFFPQLFLRLLFLFFLLNMLVILLLLPLILHLVLLLSLLVHLLSFILQRLKCLTILFLLFNPYPLPNPPPPTPRPLPLSPHISFFIDSYVHLLFLLLNLAFFHYLRYSSATPPILYPFPATPTTFLLCNPLSSRSLLLLH